MSFRPDTNKKIKIMRNENGYVLLEALFSILILSIGIIAALQALKTTLHALQYREYTLAPARQLAEKIMAEVELNTFAKLPNFSAATEGNIDSFHYQITKTKWPVGTSLNKITVKISWNDRGKPGTFSLTTILPFQQE
ncbi:MAG: hypothetical protein DWQ05_07725 [Calditrichaeota bacterium]|nr:MAG: hypothetical protein DWQ05_07725 [Calditrichota bacterium]